MKNFPKFLLAILVLAFAYTGYEISRLSDRIQKIENKLGGPKKIACTEKETIEKVKQSVVRVVGGESEGSGFAVQKKGFILTNFHVIASEPNPKVILPDNTFETARIVTADKDADLAVIKINKDLPVLSLAPIDGLIAAEEVFSIGYPLGGDLPGESSVLKGAISRVIKDKTNGVQYIVTNITGIPGISGGPMVNVYGEVIGINTAGLVTGGMFRAISADSIREKCHEMSNATNPLKDVRKIVFQPNKNALEAVRSFYNYLKARKLEKAFELLSGNFVKGHTFAYWAEGYRPLLDTTIILIKPDKKIANRINVKLSTKDLVDNDIIYKYFEGYWDVRQIEGKWLLWHPRIQEIKDPNEYWRLDQELIAQLEESAKAKPEYEEYLREMYEIAHEPGNEQLSPKELYDRAKVNVSVPQSTVPESWHKICL